MRREGESRTRIESHGTTAVDRRGSMYTRLFSEMDESDSLVNAVHEETDAGSPRSTHDSVFSIGGGGRGAGTRICTRICTRTCTCTPTRTTLLGQTHGRREGIENRLNFGTRRPCRRRSHSAALSLPIRRSSARAAIASLRRCELCGRCLEVDENADDVTWSVDACGRTRTRTRTRIRARTRTPITPPVSRTNGLVDSETAHVAEAIRV